MTNPHSTTATSTGLGPTVAGAIAYLLGPITGGILLFLEKDNRFVRYHAAQSITVGLLLVGVYIALSIVSTLLAVVPVLGWIIALLLTIGAAVGSLALWIALMWRAYQGQEPSVPIAGPLARRIVG